MRGKIKRKGKEWTEKGKDGWKQKNGKRGGITVPSLDKIKEGGKKEEEGKKDG